MRRVTSAARPSAPSAAAGNDVAIEKNTTVPRCAVASTAPCSQPGTSTQTTVTSAGPPAAATASASATGSRASASAAASGSPASSSAVRSASTGTTPMVLAAPARRAAARARLPLLPAPPRTATTGRRPPPTARALADVARHDARGQRGRTADVHDGEGELGGQVVRQLRGDGPAEEDRVPL